MLADVFIRGWQGFVKGLKVGFDFFGILASSFLCLLACCVNRCCNKHIVSAGYL